MLEGVGEDGWEGEWEEHTQVRRPHTKKEGTEVRAQSGQVRRSLLSLRVLVAWLVILLCFLRSCLWHLYGLTDMLLLNEIGDPGALTRYTLGFHRVAMVRRHPLPELGK